MKRRTLLQAIPSLLAGVAAIRFLGAQPDLALVEEVPKTVFTDVTDLLKSSEGRVLFPRGDWGNHESRVPLLDERVYETLEGFSWGDGEVGPTWEVSLSDGSWKGKP